ncbi:phosphonate C-P lyase system protein PhnG [Pseudonocardia sichuanensis]
MNTEHRCTALSTVASADIEGLADRILAAGPSIRVIAGPQVVSTPIRYPMAVPGRPTCVVGHVALSTCAVELDDTRGDGVRHGRDLVGAVAAAVCDAEVERRGPLAAEVIALCEAAETVLAGTGRSRASLVAATRVGGAP